MCWSSPRDEGDDPHLAKGLLLLQADVAEESLGQEEKEIEKISQDIEASCCSKNKSSIKNLDLNPY